MSAAEITALTERFGNLEKQLLESEERNKQDVRFAVPEGCPTIPLPKPINVTDGDLAENFNLFKQSWENYLVASGLTKQNEEIKKAVLLSAIGEDVFKRYQNIPFTADEKLTERSLLIAIGKNLTPSVNKRYERAMFNSAKQESDESYDDFIGRLRGLIKNCQYGDMADDLLLDKIIISVKHISLRERMWLDKDITLEKAIDLCKSKEVSDKQLKEIEKQSGSSTSEVNKVLYQRSQSTVPRKPMEFDTRTEKGEKCRNCGYVHGENQCSAKNKICHACQSKGHYSRVCVKSRSKEGKVYTIQSTDEDSQNSSYLVLKINDESEGVLKSDLQFCINKAQQIYKNVKCQLDTGATCNVIGLDTLCDILEDNNPMMTSTTTRLRAYGGNIIIPVGEISLQVRSKNEEFELKFMITSYDHIPLISSKACELLKLIKVCNTVVENSEAQAIMDKYDSVFTGLGVLSGKVSLEVDESIKPVSQAPRRFSLPMRNVLQQKLKEMEDLDVICSEDKYTEWTSNILMVKGDGKIRLCLDPVELNKALKDCKYQLPIIEEVLPMLSKARVFTTVDAKHGFWQLELDEESSKLTTFWTPFGRKRFKRMPFGIKPAMEIYQRKQNQIVQGLDGVFAMADDILIVGRGETDQEALEDHNRNWEALLMRLKDENLKLNRNKVRLCLTEVIYYGHILSKDGVKADPNKITSILNMKEPENREDVLRFLGMVTYLGKFLPNLSTVAEPLRKLTHLSSDFVWSSEVITAFNKLKQMVTETPILRYFDSEKPVVIQTDASSFGLGCVMMQDDGPVGFGAKALNATQRNYAQIEKEMLAIVFACKRFDQFICGKTDVTVETDHKPLISIVKKSLLKAPKRLQAMIMSLQRYNLTLKYTKGSEVIIADTLSRAPGGEINEEKAYDIYNVERLFSGFEEVNSLEDIQIREVMYYKIKEELESNETLRQLSKTIKEGWPENISDVIEPLRQYWNYRDELVMSNSLILKGSRILIPPSIVDEIFDRLHISHSGVEYTLKLAKEAVFWPKMAEKIKERIGKCEICLKHSSNQQKEPMISHEVPETPFEKVSMDCFEMNVNNTTRRFLVTTDHFTDMFEVDELRDMSSRTTILACKRNFSRYGIPRYVISDGGTNFSSSEFETFSKKWEFKHTMSSPNHQQGNGKAESGVKVAENLIKKAFEDGDDVFRALLIHRNTPNKTGYSPAKRMFGRWLRCFVPVDENKLKSLGFPNDVVERMKKERDKSKFYYDKKSRSKSPLKIGDKVFMKKESASKIWQPAVVTKEVKDRSAIVTTSNGGSYRRNTIHLKKVPSSSPLASSMINNSTDNISNNDHSEQLVTDSSSTGVSQDLPRTEPEVISSRPTRHRRQPVRFDDFEMN